VTAITTVETGQTKTNAVSNDILSSVMSKLHWSDLLWISTTVVGLQRCFSKYLGLVHDVVLFVVGFSFAEQLVAD